MIKNTSGQKLYVYVWDATTGLGKTGDASNLTAYVDKDYAGFNALGDTSATEVDSTNKKGLYQFDLTQGETNADTLTFFVKSSTSNITGIAWPPTLQTVAPNFSATSIDSSGRLDIIKVNGTSQTAGDIYSKVSGLTFTVSNKLDANVYTWNGTAVASPATAGIPEVNVKNINNVSTSSVTAVNANQGTTQPINFHGTSTTAYVKSDLTEIADAGVSTSAAQLGVNIVNAAGTAWGSGAITAASIATDAITAAKIAADAIGASELAADAVAEIADGVWDEVQSGHTTSGTFGKYLDAAVSGVSTGGVSAADIATAVWTDLLSGSDFSTVASIGKLLKDDIDATISSRGTSTLTQTQVTGGAYALNSSSFAWDSALDFSTTQKSSIGTAVAASAVASVTGNVGGNVAGSVGSVTGAVGSVTGNVGGNVTGSVGSIATGGITSSSFASGAIDAAAIATDAIGSAELAASAVTEIVTGVLTTQMTESYRSLHAAPTLAQANFEILAHLGSSAISSTTKTTKKVDGSTTAKTYTLDSTTPTSITEAS